MSTPISEPPVEVPPKPTRDGFKVYEPRIKLMHELQELSPDDVSYLMEYGPRYMKMLSNRKARTLKAGKDFDMTPYTTTKELIKKYK